jgi:membrane protein DedA with SNARE-associated domain
MIARFTPGLLTPSSVASGMLKINYTYFLIGIFIHSIIADTILILIGYLGKFGLSLAGINLRRWQVITVAIVLVLALSLGLFFYQHLRAKKAPQKNANICESDQFR